MSLTLTLWILLGTLWAYCGLGTAAQIYTTGGLSGFDRYAPIVAMAILDAVVVVASVVLIGSV